MKKILKLLESDARMSLEQIAQITELSIDEVATKIDEYEREKVILGYKAIVNWGNSEFEGVTALVELKVTPQKGMGFDDVAKQIYRYKEVESVYLMSGGFDLVVTINGKSMKDVARMISEEIAPMETILSTATHFIMKKYKEQGVILDVDTADNREVILC